MTKARLFALAAVVAMAFLGPMTPGYAASAHNSQAGADGPSNVNAPTRTSGSAQG